MKFKKSLSLFVALSMFFVAVPAFATEEIGEDNASQEAQIIENAQEVVDGIVMNEVSYDTLNAAIEAATSADGDYVITLASGTNDEDIVIHQTEGVNITIKGNGEDTIFTGYVDVRGHCRYKGAETLTFDNVVFKTEEKGHVFIEQTCQTSTSESSEKCYPHNITVQNCIFEATGEAENTAVGMKYRYGYNIKVKNIKSTGLHSLMQNYAGVGLEIDNVDITGKSGIALGTSQNVTVKNARMNVTAYGLRIDAGNQTETVIEDCNIEAFIPVVVRYVTDETPEYTLKFSGTNTMNETNSDGVWCAVGEKEYEDGVEVPREITNVKVTLNDKSLNKDGVAGEYTVLPTGSNSPAYTKEVEGYVRVWGEAKNCNAYESFALKLYSGDSLIATTTLNNIEGIIDGDIDIITWNFFYPESNDEYWTTVWEEGHPNSLAQPTKVELIVDGTVVATTPAKMSGADDINPVIWEELGGVKKAVTGLSGTGTENDPYLINNLEELKWFRDYVNTFRQDGANQYAGKFIKLTCDIDLDEDGDGVGEEWTPIKQFNGVFDGQNHIISNLFVNGGTKSDQGFFAQTNNGEIKNVTFNNANVSGRLNVGVVTGTPYTSKYTNIKITGHVEVDGMSYVGGMGGKDAYADITDITIDVDDTSYVKANSVENGTAYRTYVGGVVGFMSEGGHKVSNVHSNIDVIGSTCDVGGIVGIAHYGNTLSNVTCSGKVICENEGETEVGGIAGVWHNQVGYTVTFENVSYTGTSDVSIVGTAYNADSTTEENSGSLIIDGKIVYPIPELPTATVTVLENDELTFALNFKGDESTDKQLAYYGDWYADYVLSVNKDVTFNASSDSADGYLSGQYDAWSEEWVNVPFEDVTLKAGESIKVMEYAATLMGQSGLKLTYNDVYNFVKDFNCGVYFTDEFLFANPDFEVSLELKMYNPHNEEESYTIGEVYNFQAPLAVASVNGRKYASLQEAMSQINASNGEDVVIELLSDVDGTDYTSVAWNSYSSTGANNVTIDGKGYTIKGLTQPLIASTWTGETLEIKNLTIADSNIVYNTEATTGVAAFVGMVDSTHSIIIDNCHFTNSSINGGKWTGAMVGYAAGYNNANDGPVFTTVTVTGCSVTDSTIIAKGSVGGVVGHATGSNATKVVVDSVTVSGNTITSTDDAYNKAGSICGTIGAAGTQTAFDGSIGGVNVSATVKDNTVTSNGTEITTIYGRKGSEGGLITLTGGAYDEMPIGASDDFAKIAHGCALEYEYPYFVVVEADVAKIGKATFKSLQTAIDSAKAGDIITLITDVVLQKGLKISADDVITIDLAGKTVSQAKKQTNGYQMILNDGSLTIEDSIGGGKISYIDLGNGGEYISDTIYNRGVLTVNGGTIENLSSDTVATNGYPHAIDTYSGIRDTSVTINNGIVYCESYSAIRMFCVSSKYKNDLNINGGTIKGAIDFQNGTSTSSLGSLNITDGTFETTANTNNMRIANWTGATGTGDLFTASVSGGTFNGGIYTKNVDIFDNKFVSGGIFKSSGVVNYLAQGYTIEYDSVNKAFAVKQAKVAAIGSAKYTSLQDAVNDGGEITLLADVTENITIADDQSIVLDLNGKTLTGYIAPCKPASLTVKNGSIKNLSFAYSAIEINAGELVLNDVNIESERHAVRIDGAVTATINGGTYKTLVNYEVTAHAVNVSGTATVTINGGTFYGPKGTPNGSAMGGSALNVRDNAFVTVNGGTFSNGVRNTINAAAVTNIVVKDGTFDEDVSKYTPFGYTAVTNDNSVWTIQEVKVILENNTVSTTGAKKGNLLVLASYTEDGRMIDVKYVSLEVNITDKVISEFGLNTQNTKEIKAFMIKDFTTMYPLCAAAVATN